MTKSVKSHTWIILAYSGHNRILDSPDAPNLKEVHHVSGMIQRLKRANPLGWDCPESRMGALHYAMTILFPHTKKAPFWGEWSATQQQPNVNLDYIQFYIQLYLYNII